MSDYLQSHNDHSPSTLKENDFDPVDYSKAQDSWQAFGKLSQYQVGRLLRESPEDCEEHFAHMGPVAFEYLFPVLDRYLRAVDPRDKNDHREVIALGYSIAAQLGTPVSEELFKRISDLTDLVLSKPKNYINNRTEQRKLAGSWKWVMNRLERIS